jgi:isovaleryl-CoA dehydrogenase
MHPRFQELYDPTEEHRMLRAMLAEFTQREVEPQAALQDEITGLNRPLFRRLADLGLLGLTVPEAFGGGGMDATASVLVHHELSKSDPGFCLAYLAHAILFVNNVVQAGSPEQLNRFLPRALSGEWVCGMGMTEPQHGTDVLGMSTTARRSGDDYVLNGCKTYITNGPEGDAFVVYAKIDGRISAFVVERSTEGFSTSKPIKKMGMRASSMGELVFEDCRVPKANLLGEEGSGVVHMMRNLEIERLTLGAISLGIADRCLKEMLTFAKDRVAFGKPIAEFGQIQRYIGEAYAMTEAARALVYSVARAQSPDTRNRIGTDAAKLFAAPVGKTVADYAIQVMGGAGYCTEYVVERFFRDAKLLEIGGGTLESHQKNLAKDLLKELA